MFKKISLKFLAILLTFSIGFTPLKGDAMAAGVGAAVGGPPGAVIIVGATAYVAGRLLAQHRKNARQSTRDKHTKLRAGRNTTKNRQKKDWRSNLNKRHQN